MCYVVLLLEIEGLGSEDQESQKSFLDEKSVYQLDTSSQVLVSILNSVTLNYLSNIRI